jgi:hypothetical protein
MALFFSLHGAPLLSFAFAYEAESLTPPRDDGIQRHSADRLRCVNLPNLRNMPRL